MRRHAEHLPLSGSAPAILRWVWLLPLAVIATGLASHLVSLAALGIGLAAGLSLSGSI